MAEVVNGTTEETRLPATMLLSPQRNPWDPHSSRTCQRRDYHQKNSECLIAAIKIGHPTSKHRYYPHSLTL